MAFNQFKLDQATEQARGIFNQYVYETDDLIADCLVSGYWDQSRFAKTDPDWIGSIILIKASDGVHYVEIDGSGSVIVIDTQSIYVYSGTVDADGRIYTGINDSTLTFDLFNLESTDYTKRGKYELGPNKLNLFVSDGDGAGADVAKFGLSIDLDLNKMEILDEINSKGLVYADDYSGNYTERSLIDKGWLDLEFITGRDLYVKGGPEIDGSLRLVPDTEHDETGIQFELRNQGVWNVTTIDLLGESSIALGHSVELGLAGDHLHLLEADGDESIIPTRHFSDAAGSADADESVKLDPIVNESVLQPDNSGVLTNGGTGAITWTYAMGLEKLIHSIWFRAHSDFTVNVEITLRKDNASGGILHRRKYPYADFIDGVSVEFPIPGMFEVEDFQDIWFQVEPLVAGTIDLDADVTNTYPWLALTYYNYERVPLMNYHSGVDAIIYEEVTVGSGGNAITIYPAILTTEGNQITYVPSTTV